LSDYNIYEVNIDLYNILKDINTPLVAVKNSIYDYEPINKMGIINSILDCENNILYDNLTEITCIVSPNDINKNIIITKSEVKLLNNMINICTPIESQLSLMGIYDIKEGFGRRLYVSYQAFIKAENSYC